MHWPEQERQLSSKAKGADIKRKPNGAKDRSRGLRELRWWLTHSLKSTGHSRRETTAKALEPKTTLMRTARKKNKETAATWSPLSLLSPDLSMTGSGSSFGQLVSSVTLAKSHKWSLSALAPYLQMVLFNANCIGLLQRLNKHRAYNTELRGTEGSKWHLIKLQASYLLNSESLVVRA